MPSIGLILKLHFCTEQGMSAVILACSSHSWLLWLCAWCRTSSRTLSSCALTCPLWCWRTLPRVCTTPSRTLQGVSHAQPFVVFSQVLHASLASLVCGALMSSAWAATAASHTEVRDMPVLIQQTLQAGHYAQWPDAFEDGA